MEPLKNLFNLASAKKIANAMKRGNPKFDSHLFLKDLGPNLEILELKERVYFLTERLSSHLPRDPKKSIPLLLKALKQNPDDLVGLDQFALWPLTHFISLYGLNDFDLSMAALKEMTKLFTSEFAVRAFFIKDQERTLKIFKVWMNDENEHVRRLVSEGSRPLLPWGQKLQGFALNPKLTWPLLEKLKNDPSEYVRKSVANHINDHSKNHPEFVVTRLLEWHNLKSKNSNLTWVIKHASRTLIKKGYKKAFLLHGVEDQKIKVISQKIISKKLILGENFLVEVVLKNFSKKPALVILDHEFYFLNSYNRHGLKVFKGKKIILEPGKLTKVEMSIALKPVTTRAYFSGKQLWNIKMNGLSQKSHSFILTVK